MIYHANIGNSSSSIVSLHTHYPLTDSSGTCVFDHVAWDSSGAGMMSASRLSATLSAADFTECGARWA